jgi:hypothetical protein
MKKFTPKERSGPCAEYLFLFAAITPANPFSFAPMANRESWTSRPSLGSPPYTLPYELWHNVKRLEAS